MHSPSFILKGNQAIMWKLLKNMYSLAVREVKMYNIEKRAEQVISKEKPVPAPKYPSTLLELDRLKEENVSKEYLSEKNNQLDGYLKKVYVTTRQSKPDKTEISPDQRRLPQSRFTDNNSSLYGYSESEEKTTSAGRLSLKQALQLISDHHSDPIKHSNTYIAAEYKLPITLTDDILGHFKLFDVHFQSKKRDSTDQSSYSKLQQRVKDMNLRNANQILRESSEFKQKDLFNRNKQETIKDKENINVDDINSGLKNDDKKKL